MKNINSLFIYCLILFFTSSCTSDDSVQFINNEDFRLKAFRELSNGTNYSNSLFFYDPFGKLIAIEKDDDYKIEFNYNNMNRVGKIHLIDNLNSSLDTYIFSYNTLGKIHKIQSNSSVNDYTNNWGIEYESELISQITRTSSEDELEVEDFFYDGNKLVEIIRTVSYQNSDGSLRNTKDRVSFTYDNSFTLTGIIEELGYENPQPFLQNYYFKFDTFRSPTSLILKSAGIDEHLTFLHFDRITMPNTQRIGFSGLSKYFENNIVTYTFSSHLTNYNDEVYDLSYLYNENDLPESASFYVQDGDDENEISFLWEYEENN